MKSLLKKLLKFLPVIVIVIALTTPHYALAQGSVSDAADAVISWVKNTYDTATEFGAKALDLAKGCVKDVHTCSDDIKKEMERLALKALDLLYPDNCVLKSSGGSCVFCEMFKTIFNAAAKVAAVSYSAFAGTLGDIVLAFLAVSLALIVLKNISSFGSKDAGAMLNDLFARGFVCAGIYIILKHDYLHMFNLTIGAVISDGLSLVSSSGGGSSTGFAGYASAAGAHGGQMMPNSVGTQIDLAIRHIERQIYQLFNYGDYAFCLGTGPERLMKVIWHPVYLIDGILLYIGGIFFMVGYPWVMADAVLQLGIALALLPFAVAGYAFGGTKQYLPKTFSWILHSLFVFIFMSILINCVLSYIDKILRSVFRASGSGLFVDAVNGLAFYGSNMIKVLFILAIGWTYMPEIKELAKNFAQGSGLSAGAKVGQTVGNKMEQGAEKAAKYAGKQTWEGTKAAGRATARFGHSMEREGAKILANKFGHEDAEGNMVFTVGGKNRGKLMTFLTGGLEFKVERHTAGDITDSRGKKIASSGANRRLAHDATGHIIGTVDKNGNVIRADGSYMGRVDANGNLFDRGGNIIAKAGEKEVRMIYDNHGNMTGFVDNLSKRDSNVVKDFNGNVLGKLDDDGNVINTGGGIVGSVFKTGKAAMDENGKIIGFVDPSGQVKDENGKVIGKADHAGFISGTEIINANKIEREVLDGAGHVIGFVNADGLVKDASGKVIAHDDGRGNLLNADGNVIGRRGERVIRNEDGSVKYKIDTSGNVEDTRGNSVGKIDIRTGNVEVTDKPLGRVVDNVKFAYDNAGRAIGHIQKDGTVKDFHGNILGGVHNKSGSSDVLKREHTSIVGRRHVMYSDRYCTIKEIYTSSGKLIKRDVKFKYHFLTKYLVNSSGKINQGALQKLMTSSSIAQDPNLRKLLMQQVTKEILKKQGHSISKWFHRGQQLLDYQESRTIGTVSGNIARDERGNVLGTVKKGRVFDNYNRVIGSVIDGKVVTDTVITIKQGNHSGETLTYGLRIDARTGQTCTQFLRDSKETHTLHQLERKAKKGMHKDAVKTFAGRIKFDSAPKGGEYMLHDAKGDYYNKAKKKFYLFKDGRFFVTKAIREKIYTHAKIKTFLGTNYEIGSDEKGDYYVRDRKKYLFFGPRVSKKFYTDETLRTVDKTGYKGIRNTIRPFVPAGVGAGVAVGTALLAPAALPLALGVAGVGGLWTLFSKTKPDSKAEITAKLGGQTQAKDWRYNYKARFDVNTGKTVYSRSLRKFWNPKNYVRMPARTAKALLKTSAKAVIKTTTNILSLPIDIAYMPVYILLNPVATAKKIRHPINTIKNSRPVRNFRKDWNQMKEDFGYAADGLQTGNIEEYTDDGKKIINSSTGETMNADFEQSVTTERLDGSKTVKDLNSNDEVFLDKNKDKNKKTAKREMQFNNGMVEIKVKATISPDGYVQYETTTVHYSDKAQKGHDSFLSSGDDKYQIVSSSGAIATDLQPENAGSFYLTFGMDNLCGTESIGGMNCETFIVSQILAMVREKKTNKLQTDFSKELS